eukprot:12922499-Prorocentrum_lima.AAC.1
MKSTISGSKTHVRRWCPRRLKGAVASVKYQSSQRPGLQPQLLQERQAVYLLLNHMEVQDFTPLR